MKFIEKNFKNLLIIILFLIIGLGTCHYKKALNDCGTIKSDTTIVHTRDTLYEGRDTVYLSVSVPQAKTITKKPRVNISSVYHEDYVKECEEIADDYHSVKTYSDTYPIFDSAFMKKVGVFIVNDTLSKNSFIARGIKVKLDSLPVIHDTIKTTITNTITAKAKNKWYIGGEIMGNKTDIVNGASIGLILANKKNNLYSLKLGGITNNSIIVPNIAVGIYKRL